MTSASPSRESLVAQIAKWVALAGLFILPLMPLIVANSQFFPFITGKAFFLRITVEFVVAAWVVLCFVDRRYRPRRSWIGIAVLVFVAWMALADSFAINATKAFWSNFERMEGWVWLVHLAGFFFAGSAILRVTGKWRAWFLTMLAVSVWIVGYALLQLNGSLAIHQGSTRIDATLGNSAYLAIYLLFSVFVALWLALTERQAWLKYLLLALAVVEGVLIFFTETRGTMIALIVTLTLAALLTLMTAGKRARQGAVIGLLVIFMGVGALYLARDSDFVRNNTILLRLTSVSLNDGSTRFTLWHMAWQGALERPLVGWGQEGYNYVFNKYYDPALYQQEQWFDRAHSTFIDWLVAGGFPAFFLYLALFGSGVVLLWRSSELSRPERIALTAALVGYAIHNIFVFDNLTSYLYFFGILALIDSQVSRPVERIESLPELDENSGLTLALPLASVALIVTVWLVNVPGLRVARELITTLSSSSVEGALVGFESLSSHPSFAAQEVREQLINFAASLASSQQVPNELRAKTASLAESEIRKQIEAYPLDTRGHLQLAYLYRAYGAYEEALKKMKEALLTSPKKIDIFLEQGVTQWDHGLIAEAQKSFAAAYALGPQFTKLAEYTAAGHIAAGDQKSADALLLKVFGTTTVDSLPLATAYARGQNASRLIPLLELRIRAADANVQAWFSLASVYYNQGNVARALELLQEAKTRFPSNAQSADDAIKQVLSGKVLP